MRDDADAGADARESPAEGPASPLGVRRRDRGAGSSSSTSGSGNGNGNGAVNPATETATTGTTGRPLSRSASVASAASFSVTSPWSPWATWKARLGANSGHQGAASPLARLLSLGANETRPQTGVGVGVGTTASNAPTIITSLATQQRPPTTHSLRKAWAAHRWNVLRAPLLAAIISVVASFVMHFTRARVAPEKHEPHANGLLGLMYVTLLLVALQRQYVSVRLLTMVLPLMWVPVFVVAASPATCEYAMNRELCANIFQGGEAPHMYFSIPLYVVFLGYLTLLPSFADGWADTAAHATRIVLAIAVGYTTYGWTKSIPVAFSIFWGTAGQVMFFKEYEAGDLEQFAKRIADERERAALNALATSEHRAAVQDSDTLLRNAVKLGVPNSAIVDSSTVQRIERTLRRSVNPAIIERVRSSTAALDGGHHAHAAMPRRPLPRYISLPCAKLRSVEVFSSFLDGKPCVVRSISDLSALDDRDLEEFVTVACLAVAAPPIPGVTKTLGFQWTPSVHVVDEHVSGGNAVTLRDLALELSTSDLRLDWTLFQPLGVCMAKALVAVHEAGLLHREISSQTVALMSATQCVLSPIGLLHALPEARRKVWGHVHGIRVAPEVRDVGDHAAYTRKCDVWALCVVAWELLCGPFSEASPLAFPSTVPLWVANVIEDGVSADPERRPTAKEVLDAFARVDSDASVVARESAVLSSAVFEQVLSRVTLFEDPSKEEEEAAKAEREMEQEEASGGSSSAAAHA